jgi:hypothetical protein
LASRAFEEAALARFDTRPPALDAALPLEARLSALVAAFVLRDLPADPLRFEAPEEDEEEEEEEDGRSLAKTAPALSSLSVSATVSLILALASAAVTSPSNTVRLCCPSHLENEPGSPCRAAARYNANLSLSSSSPEGMNFLAEPWWVTTAAPRSAPSGMATTSAVLAPAAAPEDEEEEEDADAGTPVCAVTASWSAFEKMGAIRQNSCRIACSTSSSLTVARSTRTTSGWSVGRRGRL